MRPSIWPDWLEKDEQTALLAKSLDYSIGDKPETLAEHTWFVMQRLSELIHLRPNLSAEIEAPNLWHILFWASFLHDFGKAARGFQNRLRGGERWPQRHEVLSLVFVDWIAESLSYEEQQWLVAAIVSHHKDAAKIQLLYPEPDPDDPYDLENDQLPALVAELSLETLEGLWRWLAECPQSWRMALNLEDFGIKSLSVLDKIQAVEQVQKNGANRIYHWLDVYHRFVKQVNKSKAMSDIIGTVTLRGYLINADHCASSHRGPLPRITLEIDVILQKCKIHREMLYTHQLRVEQIEGSVLLMAPTGSGKTEAALLWVVHQMFQSLNQLRLFYTLPYQASMNAMWLRLNDIFGEDEQKNKPVALQHGRAAMAHYRMLLEKEDDDANPEAVLEQVKLAKDMAKLNYPPIRVFSPYQMLKGAYRLRGYEKQLSDYHHALFIFDEIHAYEAKRLALILKTVKYLRQNFQARFIVMSATFPQVIKDVLEDALGDVPEIKADETLFDDERFQRHRLKLKDGELLASLDEIAQVAKNGKSVLVACNRVAVAQDAYHTLSKMLPPNAIIALLHGKFNMRDRSELEKMVRKYAGAEVEQSQPFVLVATQAVEVSLDIDLDTIYSEPAPLDALIQRFGRVNRRGKKGIVNVHVFRECEWDRQQYVYDTNIVEATLQVLEDANNQSINENKLGQWLDKIYTGEIAAKWREEYEQTAKEFERTWLRRLRAFEAITKKTEQDFYKLFDGVEVLPKSLVVEYEDYLEEKSFIEANELLVPMRFGQLQSIHTSRKDPLYFDGGWPIIVDLPYSSDLGLDMSQAREAVGRTISVYSSN